MLGRPFPIFWKPSESLDLSYTGTKSGTTPIGKHSAQTLFWKTKVFWFCLLSNHLSSTYIIHCSNNFRVNIEMSHLFSCDPRFEESILQKPDQTLEVMEEAIKKVAEDITLSEIGHFEICLSRQDWQPESLRNLAKSQKVGKLVKISGMVVRCKRPGIRYKVMALKCKQCGHEVSFNISGCFLSNQTAN